MAGGHDHFLPKIKKDQAVTSEIQAVNTLAYWYSVIWH